jgi:hypothetical protein
MINYFLIKFKNFETLKINFKKLVHSLLLRLVASKVIYQGLLNKLLYDKK